MIARVDHEPRPTAVTGQSVADMDAAIATLADICERAGAGDLEARAVGFADDPRLGRLSRSVNSMLDIADSFVREAAAAMENCSHDQFHRPILLRGLKGAYRQSAAIINAAGAKMKENSDEIGFVERLAADNLKTVNAVASSCDQLSKGNSEIAREAAESAQVTRAAVAEGARVEGAVSAMNEAVRTIDSIVALINSVAEQTNLLALNATIEAARAGEVGKGFAVVATEVKELSRNTARATGEIAQQVQKLRQTATDVSRLIGGINASVQHIDASAETIATSVGYQIEATADITHSIAEVSKNARQVSERIQGARAAAGKPRPRG